MHKVLICNDLQRLYGNKDFRILPVAEGYPESPVCIHIKYLSRCGSFWVADGRWNRKQF